MVPKVSPFGPPLDEGSENVSVTATYGKMEDRVAILACI